MTISIINLNVGTAANDGTGDPLRTGMQSANTNFSVIKSAIDTLQTDVPAAIVTSKAYADSLVVGLWDDRGTFNASTNLFPTTGGSGTAGAILKGDIWTIGTIATSGVLLGYPIGSTVRALTDTPGQTVINWAIGNTGIGYVPENSINKDAAGGYVGKTTEKINFYNTARTFMSFLSNVNTAAHTYLFPDRDITVAGIDDITTTNLSGVVPTSKGGTGEASVTGWVVLTGATYLSADSPTFVASFTGDLTTTLSLGNRIKLTQSSTVKYFLITAIGAYSGGVTPITLYGGTDYILTNSVISALYFSIYKAPFGFPVVKSKWRVLVTDTTPRSQANTVVGTKYNLGSLQISVPIGAWDLGYSLYAEAIGSSSQWAEMAATLSTANNTESNTALTAQFRLLTGLTTSYHGMPLSANVEVSVIVKTIYYLNAWSWIALQASIAFYAGATKQTRIYADSAYL